MLIIADAAPTLKPFSQKMLRQLFSAAVLGANLREGL